MKSLKHRNFFFILMPILFSIMITGCDKDNGAISDGDKHTTTGEYLDYGSGGSNGNSGDSAMYKPGQITAGEWNDLSHWDFWDSIQQTQEYSKMPAYWDYNLSNRIEVELKNTGNTLLKDIKVELLNNLNETVWTSKTNNIGKAELWPLTASEPVDYKLRINAQIYSSVILYKNGINSIKITGSNTQDNADIAFMVDATGSMGDELEYLKVELVDVLSKVKESNGNINLQTGCVFYRDEGDDYLTRKSDFTANINTSVNFIKSQSASGGGDFPEAVHTALNVAVNNLQWSTTARSRILFLLLDAPPHYESQIVSTIHSLIKTASEKGIRIVPIVASGIDKETEFLMRYMAIATNGTYVFINNVSGIGNEHLEPTIGPYQTEYLNELMIRIINQYLQ